MSIHTKALILSRTKIDTRIPFPTFAKNVGLEQSELKRLIDSEETDESIYDKALSNLDVEVKDVTFSHLINVNSSSIEVGDEDDFSYKFMEMASVHEDLIDFLDEETAMLYWDKDLEKFISEFEDESLEALSLMVEANGFKKYGLKLYFFKQLMYKKL